MTAASLPAPSDDRATRSVEAFTRAPARPHTTFPLVLCAVTIAVLAMHADAVMRYSTEAFWAGVVATIALAVGVGQILSRIQAPFARSAATILLPTAAGAIVGVVVQSLVLVSVRGMSGDDGPIIVRDLGGAVDTTDATSWLLGGVVLGAVPALAVCVFLGLAGRTLRKLVGNDASEGFAVAFTGATGVVAGFGLVVVHRGEAAPLMVVLVGATLSLLVALLVDGSRIGFVRRVFKGEDGAFEIVPQERFTRDQGLASLVSDAGTQGGVLVRIDRRPGSYRSAAAEPIALLGATEAETLRPLLRRRVAACVMLAAMGVLGLLATSTHGLI